VEVPFEAYDHPGAARIHAVCFDMVVSRRLGQRSVWATHIAIPIDEVTALPTRPDTSGSETRDRTTSPDCPVVPVRWTTRFPVMLGPAAHPAKTSPPGGSFTAQLGRLVDCLCGKGLRAGG